MSYDFIKHLEPLAFKETSGQSLKASLYDQKSDLAYDRAITASNYDNSLISLPQYMEKKLHKHQNILDKMRAQSSNDDDDLGLPHTSSQALAVSNELSVYAGNKPAGISPGLSFANDLIVPKSQVQPEKKHSRWKMFRVLIGHTGSVTSVGFDPDNEYFATGASDGTIKIWNLASGRLQLTLTGHIMAVRGIVISDRHPYMFSCSEDKTVKCWDLEKNKVVRDYHGHLSSVYTVDIHPTLDLIVTGSRDSSVKVWDIRTRTPIYTLTGHKNTVSKVHCRSTDPQIISSSMDSTVRTWDLVAGKCDKVLTYHSKSVRTFCVDESRKQFISGSADGLKKFQLPSCNYLQNLESLPHETLNEGNLILNTNCCNEDGEMFVGCENGQYGFWDWNSGHVYQNGTQTPAPGSLDSEKGILCSSFDRSGIRLVTGNVDKTVRVWKREN